GVLASSVAPEKVAGLAARIIIRSEPPVVAGGSDLSAERNDSLTKDDAVTLGQVARAVGGTLSGGDAGAAAADVTHDSRQVRAGWLFVAVRGERWDANRFVADVAARGAVGVVSELERPTDFGGAWIQVADARRA